MSENDSPPVPIPDYRPVERFWPYVDLPEQPTDEELAALSPELSEALFGTPKLPFSVTLDFPVFEGAALDRAVALARGNVAHQREPVDLLVYAQAARASGDAAARAEVRRLRDAIGLHDRRLDAEL